MPTLFIWEGVTQYISEEVVHRTLAFVGKSAPGSILVFTYVLKSIIERRSDIPGADHLNGCRISIDFSRDGQTLFVSYSMRRCRDAA